MQSFIAVLLCFIIGIFSYQIAAKRGRNPYAWFFIGLMFGIFGLVTLLLLRPVRKVSVKKAPPPAPQLKPVDPLHFGKLWYYLDPSHQQYGPMSLDALNAAWKQGQVHPDTYVWNEDLPEWKPCQNVLTST